MMRLISALVLALLLPILAHAQGRLPTIQSVTSPSGLTAWLIEDHTAPVITIRFDVAGGSQDDPPGREGASRLAMAALDEGAGPYDGPAFRAALRDQAISLGFGATRLALTGTLRMLRDRRDAAADLLALALTQPRLEDSSLAKLRRQLQVALAQEDSDQRSQAERHWRRINFPSLPDGRARPETIATLTAADLRPLLAERLVRQRLTLAVAGAISAPDLAIWLDRAFGALPAGQPARKPAPTAPADPGRQIDIAHAGPQAIILFGHALPPPVERGSADWYAAILVNHVLGGGGFGSILTQEVRDRRGLAYGIGTRLSLQEPVPMLLGSTAVAAAKSRDAADAIRTVWQQIARDGLTAQQLDDARSYLLGAFPLQFDNTSSMAGILLQMQLDGLSPDSLTRRQQILTGLSLDHVNAIARRILDPANLTLVVLGAPDGRTPSLPATNP